MTESEYGDYVEFEDYEALRQQVAALWLQVEGLERSYQTLHETLEWSREERKKLEQRLAAQPAAVESVDKLAEFLTTRVFDVGSDPDDKAQRIAFKGGMYPGKETDLGGLVFVALQSVLRGALLDYTAPPAQEQEKPE